MKTVFYKIDLGLKKKIAFVSDLHDRPCEKVLAAIKDNSPDLILVTGDFVHDKPLEYSKNAKKFLATASRLAPCFVSLGNHERFLEKGDRFLIRTLGVTLLDNSFVCVDNAVIGGLSSFYMGRTEKISHFRRTVDSLNEMPQSNGAKSFLDEFEKTDGVKILLCHHPEYYSAFIKDRKIDLVLSGHAHGGQIRLFGLGLFAPDQGIMPVFTRGIYDGKLVVSAGLANTGGIVPRLFNPTELVFIQA